MINNYQNKQQRMISQILYRKISRLYYHSEDGSRSKRCHSMRSLERTCPRHESFGCRFTSKESNSEKITLSRVVFTNFLSRRENDEVTALKLAERGFIKVPCREVYRYEVAFSRINPCLLSLI